MLYDGGMHDESALATASLIERFTALRGEA
jgi:hypothetical protein